MCGDCLAFSMQMTWFYSMWKSEDDLRAMVGWFGEACWRRGLKINVGKSKVIVLNGEEGL